MVCQKVEHWLEWQYKDILCILIYAANKKQYGWPVIFDCDLNRLRACSCLLLPTAIKKQIYCTRSKGKKPTLQAAKKAVQSI